MFKPISTKTHAVLDYATAAKFLLLPRVMGWSKDLTNAMSLVGLMKLGYTLLTRHEGGVYPVLPMKAHLALDTLGGATLCALPFLTGEQDEGATATCVGLGLFDIAAAPLTQTNMGAPAEPMGSRRAAREAPKVIRQAREAMAAGRGE